MGIFIRCTRCRRFVREGAVPKIALLAAWCGWVAASRPAADEGLLFVHRLSLNVDSGRLGLAEHLHLTDDIRVVREVGALNVLVGEPEKCKKRVRRATARWRDRGSLGTDGGDLREEDGCPESECRIEVCSESE